MHMHSFVFMFYRNPFPSFVNRQDSKAATTRLYDVGVGEQLSAVRSDERTHLA